METPSLLDWMFREILATLLNQAEIDFLNARLTYAENAGLTHAFIFFHGPEYLCGSNSLYVLGKG